ncbi:universal stress protein [Amycolatopsis sp. NPDC049253]|uniref:universal stress protein n=1 Tax=Amycolatopsis sp. NPDC049253 TaxID=3155274 RepID=UPI00341FC1A1
MSGRDERVVLAGIDGSNSALHAAEWAAAVAARRGAVLRLVQAYIVPPPGYRGWQFAPSGPGSGPRPSPGSQRPKVPRLHAGLR